MPWTYCISMRMALFTALFPLPLVVIGFVGSGMLSRIGTERQIDTLGVSQVHQVLNQLEQLTQQSAAQISEMATAGQMLDAQLKAMSTLVDRFVS